MNTIKLTVAQFNKLMRNYSNSQIGEAHPVNYSTWRDIKGHLVKDKDDIKAIIVKPNEIITTIYINKGKENERHVDCGHWYAADAYNLSYFIEYILLNNAPADANKDMSLTANNHTHSVLNTDTGDRMIYTINSPSTNGVWSTWEYKTKLMDDSFNDVISSIDSCDEKIKPLNDRIAVLEKIIINDNEEKKENTMNFNFDFGKVTNDNVRMSMYGVAVKSVDGRYVSYDAKTHSVMDVDIMNIPCGDFLYKMPVAIKDIEAGDVVIHNKVPMFVVEVHESTIKVVDIREGTEKEVYLTKNMFNFNYAIKIVSMMDMFNCEPPSADNPFGGMLPFMIMGDGKTDFKDILPMLMMSQGTNIAINPMTVYFLMKNSNTNEIDPLMMMLLMQNFSG